MIGLQFWFDFCHASTWINHRYTYVPSLLNPSHFPIIPSPLGYYRAPIWVPWVMQQIPIGYLHMLVCMHPRYLHVSVYASTLLSIYLTLSLFSPTLVPKSVLYVCVTIAALQSVPSF